MIVEAIEASGRTTDEIGLAVDAAASEWYADGQYTLPKRKQRLKTDELIGYLKELTRRFPILSIEDGLSDRGLERMENAHAGTADPISGRRSICH